MRKHFEIKKNLENKNYAYYILSNIDKIQNKYEFNCFIDITARQAAPIYPNFLLNNLVKYATENKELNIEIINVQKMMNYIKMNLWFYFFVL